MVVLGRKWARRADVLRLIDRGEGVSSPSPRMAPFRRRLGGSPYGEHAVLLAATLSSWLGVVPVPVSAMVTQFCVVAGGAGATPNCS